MSKDDPNKPRPQAWQEHYNDERYIRYHADIWMPDHVRRGAIEFLPPPGQALPLSRHYQEIRHERNLPKTLTMSRRVRLVDATVIRDTGALFRVMIRYPWYRRRGNDIVLVLEGDYEVVTAYWRSKLDYSIEDISVYAFEPTEVTAAFEATQAETRE